MMEEEQDCKDVVTQLSASKGSIQRLMGSIVIVFISSIGAFVMKLFQGFVPLEHAIWMVIGSLVMAPIGMKVGEKVPDAVQKAIIIILIVIAIIQLLT